MWTQVGMVLPPEEFLKLFKQGIVAVDLERRLVICRLHGLFFVKWSIHRLSPDGQYKPYPLIKLRSDSLQKSIRVAESPEIKQRIKRKFGV